MKPLKQPTSDSATDTASSSSQRLTKQNIPTTSVQSTAQSTKKRSKKKTTKTTQPPPPPPQLSDKKEMTMQEQAQRHVYLLCKVLAYARLLDEPVPTATSTKQPPLSPSAPIQGIATMNATSNHLALTPKYRRPYPANIWDIWKAINTTLPPDFDHHCTFHTFEQDIVSHEFIYSIGNSDTTTYICFGSQDHRRLGQGMTHLFHDIAVDGYWGDFILGGPKSFMMQRFRQSIRHSSTVVLLGHGGGGALATIVGLWLAMDESQNTNTNIQVWTFGAPKVGNNIFQKRYKDMQRQGRLCHARFVNRGDMIPMQPLLALEGFYYSVGTTLSLPNSHVLERPHSFPVYVRRIQDWTGPTSTATLQQWRAQQQVMPRYANMSKQHGRLLLCLICLVTIYVPLVYLISSNQPFVMDEQFLQSNETSEILIKAVPAQDVAVNENHVETIATLSKAFESDQSGITTATTTEDHVNEGIDGVGANDNEPESLERTRNLTSMENEPDNGNHFGIHDVSSDESRGATVFHSSADLTTIEVELVISDIDAHSQSSTDSFDVNANVDEIQPTIAVKAEPEHVEPDTQNPTYVDDSLPASQNNHGYDQGTATTGDSPINAEHDSETLSQDSYLEENVPVVVDGDDKTFETTGDSTINALYDMSSDVESNTYESNSEATSSDKVGGDEIVETTQSDTVDGEQLGNRMETVQNAQFEESHLAATSVVGLAHDDDLGDYLATFEIQNVEAIIMTQNKSTSKDDKGEVADTDARIQGDRDNLESNVIDDPKMMESSAATNIKVDAIVKEATKPTDDSGNEEELDVSNMDARTQDIASEESPLSSHAGGDNKSPIAEHFAETESATTLDDPSAADVVANLAAMSDGLYESDLDTPQPGDSSIAPDTAMMVESSTSMLDMQDIANNDAIFESNTAAGHFKSSLDLHPRILFQKSFVRPAPDHHFLPDDIGGPSKRNAEQVFWMWDKKLFYQHYLKQQDEAAVDQTVHAMMMHDSISEEGI